MRALTTCLLLLTGCTNELKALSDNVAFLESTMTAHAQVTSRIEGKVIDMQKIVTTNVSAGGDVTYGDQWLSWLLAGGWLAYMILNEGRDIWRKRKNGHKR